jgi:hypothetical protein
MNGGSRKNYIPCQTKDISLREILWVYDSETARISALLFSMPRRDESDTSGKAGGMEMRAAQSGWGRLFASDTIHKGDGYRTPVIPAGLLSRNPATLGKFFVDPAPLIKTPDSGSKALPE